jgi:hypothetical protein
MKNYQWEVGGLAGTCRRPSKGVYPVESAFYCSLLQEDYILHTTWEKVFGSEVRHMFTD